MHETKVIFYNGPYAINHDLWIKVIKCDHLLCAIFSKLALVLTHKLKAKAEMTNLTKEIRNGWMKQDFSSL